jgi:hypothetical protein
VGGAVKIGLNTVKKICPLGTAVLRFAPIVLGLQNTGSEHHDENNLFHCV